MNFAEMVESNTWHDRDELQPTIDALKPLFTPDPKNPWKSIAGWAWCKTKGYRAKYINIRIDMRDGGFIIQDRDGKRISLPEIQDQSDE